MWGPIAQAATSVVGGYFIALITEKGLGLLVQIGNDAPNSGSSTVIGWIQIIEQNFLFLVLIGIVVSFLAQAHARSKLTV